MYVWRDICDTYKYNDNAYTASDKLPDESKLVNIPVQ